MTETNTPIVDYTIRLADDSLTLGHRLSEWCSNGPFLEEDIALINVSLDYVGRARMLYAYAAETENQGRSEDDICYLRDTREYRNLLINELPKGDFAFTIVRQFFVDTFNLLFYTELLNSKDSTLAAIAGKSIKETKYHLRRSKDWMVRLGDGTEESHNRCQAAIDELWDYVTEMFDMDELETGLAAQGVAVDRTALREQWQQIVKEVTDEATLTLPDHDIAIRGGRTGIHTEHLGYLLAELQYVQRAYPGNTW
ncbi:1,2-phenylacetyl-CoA epoxidase subunit PaaC [Porticoccus sp. W117]|uniref:1,2-phenylacetyl-CoA epoxidase subunit PaaC n=1 Tax=Porticoccus sp. W117 TaxID=3054777 RepID=UPI0025994854|nr:1,2-phenylacetyl-CoA epoxidase subunit PaaC [Porticoccus sp. W117]MDM3872496.1 1,2-phenylacetyl-CoA epoxidase subunit PaaC [Porticoccus sp. W117]